MWKQKVREYRKQIALFASGPVWLAVRALDASQILGTAWIDHGGKVTGVLSGAWGFVGPAVPFLLSIGAAAWVIAVEKRKGGPALPVVAEDGGRSADQVASALTGDPAIQFYDIYLEPARQKMRRVGEAVAASCRKQVQPDPVGMVWRYVRETFNNQAQIFQQTYRDDSATSEALKSALQRHYIEYRRFCVWVVLLALHEDVNLREIRDFMPWVELDRRMREALPTLRPALHPIGVQSEVGTYQTALDALCQATGIGTSKPHA